MIQVPNHTRAFAAPALFAGKQHAAPALKLSSKQKKEAVSLRGIIDELHVASCVVLKKCHLSPGTQFTL